MTSALLQDEAIHDERQKWAKTANQRQVVVEDLVVHAWIVGHGIAHIKRRRQTRRDQYDGDR